MENVSEILKSIPRNPFGEEVTVLGASKTRTAEEIIAVAKAGVSVMGENRVQEFTAKYDAVTAAGIPYRFIGRLQTNKIKYLVGKADMIESVDRADLLHALADFSQKKNCVTKILLQINGGNEESKGGFALDEIEKVAEETLALPSLRLCGLMAVLPETDNEALLRTICLRIREKYDILREKYRNHPAASITTLSMGMSGDYPITIACGANEVRLGTILFGARNYL